MLGCDNAKATYSQMPDDKKQRGNQHVLQKFSALKFRLCPTSSFSTLYTAGGAIFFKTPRKCQCFGNGPVTQDLSLVKHSTVLVIGQQISLGSQIFYLIDEAEQTGKGANSVASMLHHHFYTEIMEKQMQPFKWTIAQVKIKIT
ncbi:hypothetical protein KUTeg_015514, partial [Tegillarca granosa]